MNNITETWKKYRNRKVKEVNKYIANNRDQEFIDMEKKRPERIRKNNPELYNRLLDQREKHAVRRGYAVMGEPVNYDNSKKGLLGFYRNGNKERAFGLSASLYQKANELPKLVKMGVVAANNPQLGMKVRQRIEKISRILQRYTPTKIEGRNNGL